MRPTECDDTDYSLLCICYMASPHILYLPMLFPGQGIVLQHFRKNEECDVVEELQPIEANLKYDFNYQVYC